MWRNDPASATHPANVIEEIVQQFGNSKALVGLRRAANDTIEETSNWDSEARAVNDKEFRKAGVVTVSEMTHRYAASYKRIVKRGIIKKKNTTSNVRVTALEYDPPRKYPLRVGAPAPLAVAPPRVAGYLAPESVRKSRYP